MASPVKAEKATACRTIVPLPEKREPSILSMLHRNLQVADSFCLIGSASCV